MYLYGSLHAQIFWICRPLLSQIPRCTDPPLLHGLLARIWYSVGRWVPSPPRIPRPSDQSRSACHVRVRYISVEASSRILYPSSRHALALPQCSATFFHIRAPEIPIAAVNRENNERCNGYFFSHLHFKWLRKLVATLVLKRNKR